MIKHIVMWKLKEQALGQPKNYNAQKMKGLLEELKKSIDIIVELEVGLNDHTYNSANYDVLLYTVFNNFSDLDDYQEHPDHLKVVDFVKQVTDQRCAVDYPV